MKLPPFNLPLLTLFHPSRFYCPDYIIIIGFALIEFFAVMGEGSSLEGDTGAGLFYSAISMLGATASVMVMLTLVRRLKLLYNINKEDERFSMAAFHAQNPTCREKCCCGGCDEACCDVHKSIWCWCCFTYQMGNHVSLSITMNL